MKARMKDLVRTPSGEVVTLGALADRGDVTFSRCDKFYKRGGGTRVAFFADHVSGAGCWEISQTAYESRTGMAISLEERG